MTPEREKEIQIEEVLRVVTLQRNQAHDEIAKASGIIVMLNAKMAEMSDEIDRLKTTK